MDENLKQYLEKYNIKYRLYEHSAVFTVAESKSIKQKIPGRHTKCLFLKDNNKNYYLVAIPADKRLNIKLLKEKLSIKDLHFASPEELKQYLNLTPGSVSIFGLIYTDEVNLIIDKELWEAKLVGFHPNINTSTIVLEHHNIEKFYNSVNNRKEIIQL